MKKGFKRMLALIMALGICISFPITTNAATSIEASVQNNTVAVKGTIGKNMSGEGFEFKDQYWEFLKQHPRETASGLTDRRETAILKWLSWQTEADQAFLEGLLNGIEDQRDPQAASVLLDAVHSRFGGQVKEKKTTRTFKL